MSEVHFTEEKNNTHGICFKGSQDNPNHPPPSPSEKNVKPLKRLEGLPKI